MGMTMSQKILQIIPALSSGSRPVNRSDLIWY